MRVVVIVNEPSSPIKLTQAQMFTDEVFEGLIRVWFGPSSLSDSLLGIIVTGDQLKGTATLITHFLVFDHHLKHLGTQLNTLYNRGLLVF